MAKLLTAEELRELHEWATEPGAPFSRILAARIVLEEQIRRREGDDGDATG